MVAECVDGLAGRKQCHLEDKWRSASAQFITFEESTDVADTAQPAVFIWGVDEVFQLVKGLLEPVHGKGKQVLVFFFPLVRHLSSTDSSCRGGKIFGSVSDVTKATIGDILLVT
jgi:hypothetical protein